MSPFVLLALVPVVAGGTVLAVDMRLGNGSRSVRQALEDYKLEEPRPTKSPRQQVSLDTAVKKLRTVIASVPNSPSGISRMDLWVTHRLALADLKLTTQEAIIIVLSLFLASLFLGNLLYGPMAALFASLIGPIVAVIYVIYHQRKRQKRFTTQLPDILRSLQMNLSAGLSVADAFMAMARTMQDPARTEFEQVVSGLGVGLTLEQVLGALVDRVRNVDLTFAVAAIIINHRAGGNLVETLKTIENTVVQRIVLRGKVRAMTAQNRMAALVVTGVPVVIGLFMLQLNPVGMSFFWTNVLGMMLGGGTILSVIVGNLVMMRITKIDL